MWYLYGSKRGASPKLVATSDFDRNFSPMCAGPRWRTGELWSEVDPKTWTA
jgi:hypothetical protein